MEKILIHRNSYKHNKTLYHYIYINYLIGNKIYKKHTNMLDVIKK